MVNTPSTESPATMTGTRVRRSFLDILTGSNLPRRRLPLMQTHSDQPGPILWLTACAHGDEVGGIVQETFKRLQRNGLLCGSVYAFPLMNPLSFETASHSIPFSEEDLNRSFPGNECGSLGERIATVKHPRSRSKLRSYRYRGWQLPKTTACRSRPQSAKHELKELADCHPLPRRPASPITN